jgi:hypothetical protein
MKLTIQVAAVAALLAIGLHNEACARGFGAVHATAAVGPAGGVHVGVAAHGVAVGPRGGVGAGGARAGTYVGPGGTVVQGTRVGGVGVGPLGGVHAGGAQAVRVTTPGGQTFVAGSAGGVRTGPYGGVAVGHAGVVAAGPYGGLAAGRVNVTNITHVTNYISPVSIRTQATYVRTGYAYPYFTANWYQAHPVAWSAARWRVASFWAAPGWDSLSSYCGITADPVVYDYGSTVVLDNDQVYYNGDVVATADEYAGQALGYADAGRAAQVADNEEWQPLGVFGLIKGDEQKAERIFQLAINKAGVLRGNYYDAVADNTLPVYGGVDLRTQRAAWSVGDKKTIVFETGLGNLNQDQTTLLLHYGRERTDQMILVRLDQPEDQNR